MEKRPNGELLIEKLHDVGKIKVKHVQTVIEPDLVYQLLRGRDVQRWHAEPSAHIILANRTDKLAGIPEPEMKRRWPKTFAYLKQFEGDPKTPKRGTLRGRSGYKQYFKPTDPFYSMYNVGPYTMAKWKVYWTRVSTEVSAAVAGGRKGNPLLSVETATFVPFEKETEAHCFAALMNSSPCRCTIENYSSKSTGSFGSPHILTNVSIPRFDRQDPIHKHLSDLSRQCHAAAQKNNEAEITALGAKIDEEAAKIWGISDAELKAIQKALADI